MGLCRMSNSTILIIIICLAASSCKGAERNTTTGKDTSILATHEQSFTIDSVTPFYQARLISTGRKLSADKKVILLLDDPTILQNPDGVYEVYLSQEIIDVKMLVSSHPTFVNVLDLYALTVADPPKYISVDLSKAAEIFKNDPSRPIIVTIVFRGNILPGNIESKKAGKMRVRGMRMVSGEWSVVSGE